MKVQIINKIRANNFKDPDIQVKIQRLWSENLPKIPSNTIKYGIYYEYQSDYTGDYTLAIGQEDNTHGTLLIPDNNKYKIYKNNSNNIPLLWQQIWSDENSKMIIRKYDYDFEKYYLNGDVEIYISIR
ncbi:effector binding domain-containing protein [Companilactobacillus kimchiensis]|uniref:Integron-associated effector binding protein domain-containing protein n=1 Tax=Companilactobacillus kimchiensis TaxID=993692 RepID=A0A0R2L7H1_9LACO|nr:effector binding domain-containing protein [Companilactobacillus kimchiensis]KRN97691.1 hypothetical protein IV57_GL001615 [Companilactobacillus kimchiensis]